MGKVVKRNGRNDTKYSITKMDFKTEMKADFYLQDKTESNLYIISIKVRYISFMKYFSCTAVFGNFNAIVPPRQKTRYIFPLLCRSLQVFALISDIPVVRT